MLIYILTTKYGFLHCNAKQKGKTATKYSLGTQEKHETLMMINTVKIFLISLSILWLVFVHWLYYHPLVRFFCPFCLSESSNIVTKIGLGDTASLVGGPEQGHYNKGKNWIYHACYTNPSVYPVMAYPHENYH